MLTQKELNDLFEYRDGELYRKEVCHTNQKVGDKVGGIDISTGYIRTRIFYKTYRVHRLIWVMHNGQIPEDLMIDHEDRNKLNNKVGNLRLVTNSQNLANSRKIKSKSSKYKGVSWNTASNKWHAHIRKDDKEYHIGYFNSEEDAREAYMIKSIELFGEFAHYD